MSFTLIPNTFPDGIQVEYHHIIPDCPIVVPLPKMTHRYKIGNTEKHYAFNKKMIEKLYNLDIKKLFEEYELSIENKNFSGSDKDFEIKGGLVFEPIEFNYGFERLCS